MTPGITRAADGFPRRVGAFGSSEAEAVGLDKLNILRCRLQLHPS